jgi:hypothetical protein
MAWAVVFGDDFDKEFEELSPAVQDELLASSKLLGTFGPQLGRPYADTLNDSTFSNMKELRSTLTGASGGSLSRSIPTAGPYSWSRLTSRAGAKSASTNR